MAPKNINKVEDGSPDTLGASFDGLGVNFAIHSKNATKVELCLFSDDGKTETARITLPKRTGAVWNGYVKDLKPGQVYGYRVDGPTDAKQGHRFNSNKVVMDPYAKEIAGEMEWTREMFDPAADSAPHTAKARVTNTLPGPPVPGPDIPRNKTVYYEMHAKGFSKLNEKVPARHLRRHRASRLRRAPEKAGRNVGGAIARPCQGERPLPRQDRPEKLLGLQHAFLFRAGA